jgi:hypothetical protein
MRKTILIAILTLTIILAGSSLSLAKDNTISLFGSYMPTHLGLEYEHRLGAFGIGAEVGYLHFYPTPVAVDTALARFNLLGRYYLDLGSSVTPYITVAPGMLVGWYEVTPVAVIPPTFEAWVDFFGYVTAGAEYKVNNLRVALELGYGIQVCPHEVPADVFHTFVFKGGIGYSF